MNQLTILSLIFQASTNKDTNKDAVKNKQLNQGDRLPGFQASSTLFINCNIIIDVTKKDNSGGSIDSHFAVKVKT